MRQVDVDSWGRVLLEEVLFRAAQQVSDEPFKASVEVDLTVRVSSEPGHDRIEIAVPSVTDALVVTYLPRPG